MRLHDNSLGLIRLVLPLCLAGQAPDWLLLEIATLSRVEPEGFKEIVLQVMGELLGGEIDVSCV